MPELDFGISDFDPFSDEALADPFSFHQNLRDRAPLLWLQKQDIWCAACGHQEDTARSWQLQQRWWRRLAELF